MTTTVKERIEKLLSELKTNHQGLAIMAGHMNRQVVSNWITRDSIGSESCLTLSKETGVSYEWLRDGTGPMFASELANGPVLGKGVPIVSWEVAKYVSENNKPILQEDVKEEFPWPLAPKNSYLLELSGDLMAPAYPNGSLILVERDAEAKHNDDVVVILGDGKMTFRRLKVSSESKWLEAVNENYPNRIINLTDDCIICGVVHDYYFSKKRI